MKKNYIQPELYVHLVQTEGLIALSMYDDPATDDDALVKEKKEDVSWGKPNPVDWDSEW